MKTDLIEIATGRRPRSGVVAGRRIAVPRGPRAFDLPVREDRVRH